MNPCFDHLHQSNKQNAQIIPSINQIRLSAVNSCLIFQLDPITSMGQTCQGQKRNLQKIEYRTPSLPDKPALKAQTRHDRYGDIEKLRTKKDGVFKLIMATNDAKMDTVSIECRIMNSVADFELYDGTKFDLQDLTLSPILDFFDSNDNQIYHHIKTQQRHTLCLKTYSFTSFRDVALKNGIYEIHLYQSLPNNPLVDHFIMSRGKINALVMLFRYYEVSLFEIVEYRRQAQRYCWTELELLHVWKSLVCSYADLNFNHVYHRDIRLGKVYYTPQNKNKPFQFTNLQSARKLVNADGDELLSVKGVNILAEAPIKYKIDSGEEMAHYDPFRYDLDCLISLLSSTLNLDPYQTNRQCSNPLLAPVLQLLRQDHVDLKNIEKYLNELINNYTPVTEEPFSDDRVISDLLVKSQLKKAYKQRITNTHLNTLILLHKKDEFHKILLQQMQSNEQHTQMKTLQTLHEVGQYYDKIGLPSNEYYLEEIQMLLDLAEQHRIKYDFDKQAYFLQRTERLYELYNNAKIDVEAKMGRERIYKYIHEQKIDNANKQLSALLNIAIRNNDLQVNLQIDVLFLKTYLQILNRKNDAAENTLEKINIILENNSVFQTQYDSKRYRAEYAYWKAYYYIALMQNDSSQIKPKSISITEQCFNSALTILTNLPESSINTMRIVNTYLLQSKLLLLKEQFTKSRKSLESADLLLRDMEASSLQGQKGSVSKTIFQRVLEQLKLAMEKENNTGQGYGEVTKRLQQLKARSEQTNAALLSRRNEQNLAEKRQLRQLNKLEKQKPIVQMKDQEDIE